MAIHPSILAWRIPMDRGVWWATVRRVEESDPTEQLGTACTYRHFLLASPVVCGILVLQLGIKPRVPNGYIFFISTEGES